MTSCLSYPGFSSPVCTIQFTTIVLSCVIGATDGSNLEYI
ncbi:hypothetical protein H375_8200 [Rickettsia prowazekii str. Breinl]|nr:hypothetical protein H374_3430 [Rickettsia prowazekii str. NMRC Madrid E]AGJ03045.1 hypothetical protein H375_8200 [Rickettsia prowazekii str. Breinl]EOB09270.1 hypothetical protein H376_9550 [Rickettsia prowazekii str. GvF12]EOB11003.1 hypothetical protein H377_1350 [Rickettsia prowazekii str. Cairo 3]